MQKKLKWYCKHILYFSVFYSGLLRLLVSFFKARRHDHSTLILFYHRFCQSGKETKLLPSLDIREFRRQILHLRRFYKFISMDALEDIVSRGQRVDSPAVVVTIDDGYLDNYILAYPILRELEIPALIYLTVGLIGTKDGLWLDDVELALTRTGVQSFRFEELFGDELLDISTYAGKKKAEQMIFTRMLKLGNPERKDLIHKLFNILNVDASEIANRPRVMLNWDEILEMSKNGISFGAHTLSHPHLPALPLGAAKHEIEKSKEIVEKQLGKPARHFAIPNGKSDDFTAELCDFCKEIGFCTIVTTEPGVVDPTSNRLSLKRVLPSPPLYYFACEIAKYLFFPKTS